MPATLAILQRRAQIAAYKDDLGAVRVNVHRLYDAPSAPLATVRAPQALVPFVELAVVARSFGREEIANEQQLNIRHVHGAMGVSGADAAALASMLGELREGDYHGNIEVANRWLSDNLGVRGTFVREFAR